MHHAVGQRQRILARHQLGAGLAAQLEEALAQRTRAAASFSGHSSAAISSACRRPSIASQASSAASAAPVGRRRRRSAGRAASPEVQLRGCGEDTSAQHASNDARFVPAARRLTLSEDGAPPPLTLAGAAASPLRPSWRGSDSPVPAAAPPAAWPRRPARAAHHAPCCAPIERVPAQPPQHRQAGRQQRRRPRSGHRARPSGSRRLERPGTNAA